MTNKEIAREFLAKHGGKISVANNCAHIQISAAGVADLWADSPAKKLPNYRSGEHSIHDDGKPYFSGGTVDEFKQSQWGKLDASKFIEQQAKLGKIKERLAEEMREINPARKRRFTENDGDIDFDRRWELTPYMGTFRTTSGIARTLRIEVEFCFNCGVKPEQISNYGAIAWAVCDAIESAGISCDIVLLSSGNGRCTGDFRNLDLEVTVKKAGEYIETLELARRFRADFYRRAMFAIYQLTGDLAGGATDCALGSSQDSYRKAIAPGTLRLRVQDATKFDAEKAIQKIKAALGIA